MRKLYFLSLFLLLVLSTTNLKAQTYCTSGLYNQGCTFGDYLTDFSFGAINQSNLNCPTTSGSIIGYNDYTIDSTSLIRGNTYTISGTTGSSPDDHIRIWIDYNNDGTFDNTSELIYDSGNLPDVTFSGNIVIPDTATIGTHRMRVRLAYNYITPVAFDACSSFNYGCTNDYTVKIISLLTPYLTVSPVSHNFGYIPYGNFSASQQFNVTGKNFYTFNDSIHISAPTGYQVSLVSNNGYDSTVTLHYIGDSLVSTPIYVIFAPTAVNTNYNANLSITGGGASALVPLMGTSIYTYCISGLYSLGCTNGDHLTAFNFGTIAQTALTCPSTAGDTVAYNDYTAITTTLKRGNSIPVSGNIGTSLDDYVKVWIDYNDDNIFDNNNEVVYNSGAFSGSTFTGNAIIAPNATLGTHRMRVRVVYDLSDFDACSQYTNGCVNDYMVNIIKNGPDVGITSIDAPANVGAIGSVVYPAVKVHNFGDTTLISIPVAYSINNGVAVVNYVDSLQPGQTLPFIFTTPFTVPDTNINICAWATTNGDVNTQNDTLCKSVTVALAHDVCVSKIVAPNDSAVVGTFQTVKAWIKNKGASTETSIPVAYQRGAGTIVNENCSGSLAFGDSTLYTFTNTFQTPSGSSYSFCVWTKLITDQDTLNNKTCKTVQITMGVNENTAIGNISISPNPAHDKLNINCNNIKNGKTIISIYDLQGKKLYNEEIIVTSDNYTQAINVSNLKMGIYFIKIENNSRVLNNKFIIE